MLAACEGCRMPINTASGRYRVSPRGASLLVDDLARIDDALAWASTRPGLARVGEDRVDRPYEAYRNGLSPHLEHATVVADPFSSPAGEPGRCHRGRTLPRSVPATDRHTEVMAVMALGCRGSTPECPLRTRSKVREAALGP